MYNVIPVLFALIGGGICAAVAANKNRSIPTWMLLGMLFPLIAVVVVMCKSRIPTAGELGSVSYASDATDLAAVLDARTA